MGKAISHPRYAEDWRKRSMATDMEGTARLLKNIIEGNFDSNLIPIEKELQLMSYEERKHLYKARRELKNAAKRLETLARRLDPEGSHE